MRKIWNFILKYRVYIVIAIIIFFGIFIGISFKAYIDPVDETVVWGDRLNGKENVPISDAKLREIESFIKEDKNVTKASVRIVGKTIKTVIITSTKDDTIEKMKELGSKIVEKFEEKEVNYYEFGFSIENKDANYALLGEKKNTNKDITWNSDEIEKSEVEVDEKEK